MKIVLQEEVDKAVEVLKKGGIICYPSDTIWGLGCDAENAKAVQRIQGLKGRDKPLIILIHDISQLYDYVQKVPDLAWDLVEFAEKPLTVVYPGGRRVAPEVLGSEGTIGIRLLKPGTFCYKMLRKYGKAVISTSANFSGQPSPCSFREIDTDLLSKVDYIVNFERNTRKETPSTVVKLELDGGIKFLRK